jgi:anti-anti-sigma regulatory factor
MPLSACAVTVKQFPEKVNMEHGRLFLYELESSMDVERPCIVFDCSRNLHMDLPAVQLLLHCLEEAMKRNGDIKLAAIPEEAKAMLKLTGVGRLFETFDTNVEAVSSYHRLPLHTALQSSASFRTSHQTAENAA